MPEQNVNRAPRRKKGFLARLIEKIDTRMAQRARERAAYLRSKNFSCNSR
jgi:hypothetical protein